jgi:primosomal protein N' (replication factor Y)
MPDVTVVDQSRSPSTGSLTPELKREMDRTLAAGGQVMLLLNRRGYSSFLLCESCGFVPQCPNCSVSLTNYRSSARLKCHYCGHQERLPQTCAQCQHPGFRTGTLGTESLEEEVQGIFPERKVIRIDRESVERKGALESALQSIASGEAEIVIGTQIIAKGHDFPNISLVGVVNADSSFHLPDFRAAEKSFQLFTQMAGRAGRGDTPGKVIIQTFNPLHPSIVHSMRHDYRGFSEEELRIRHAFGYPPFCRMARLVFSGATDPLTEKAAEKASLFLQRSAWAKELEVVGPAPAALTKVQNRYRWNLLIKAKQAGPLHAALAALAAADTHQKGESRVVLQIDVDPVSLM